MDIQELEKVVAKLQLENDKKLVSSSSVKTSLSIVEEFLKNHPLLCYGGTAINNLLPKENQFYDYSIEVPDYDFYSKTPQEHAMILSNQLARAGIKSVEVRPGIHLGTFKVYADYAAVADITHLDPHIFDKLWEENVSKHGIHYVSPNFLRMGMYLELSRPRGDVSRWVKVYSRLLLLNDAYPITCPEIPDEQTEHTKENQKYIEKILHTENVVLLGVTASQLHEKKKPNWFSPVSIIAQRHVREKLEKGHKIKVYDGTEVMPTFTDILADDGSILFRVHTPVACHSYHQMGSMKVASVPTVLQFFFAYMYSNATQSEIDHILCVAQRLMDVVNSKRERRFELLTPIDCLGKQDTLTDMREEKAKLYSKLSSKKTSTDFLRYFFTYNPHDSKTKRNQLRDALKRTRKARLGAE